MEIGLNLTDKHENHVMFNIYDGNVQGDERSSQMPVGTPHSSENEQKYNIEDIDSIQSATKKNKQFDKTHIIIVSDGFGAIYIR